jgi:hypothetical protein
LALAAAGPARAQAVAPPALPSPSPLSSSSGVAALASPGSASAAVCQTAGHRSFDFWIGHWEVRAPDGRLAGRNRIDAVQGGCALREVYRTERGYGGESLNVYDAVAQRWHQTWVDNAGTLLRLEGAVRDGGIELEGHTADPEGHVTQHRIRWTPNADGSVRQHWEQSTSAGRWSTAFDGRYTRVPGSSEPAR